MDRNGKESDRGDAERVAFLVGFSKSFAVSTILAGERGVFLLSPAVQTFLEHLVYKENRAQMKINENKSKVCVESNVIY